MNVETVWKVCAFCGIGAVKGLKTNLLKNKASGLYYHDDRDICDMFRRNEEVRGAILGRSQADLPASPERSRDEAVHPRGRVELDGRRADG